MTPEERIEKPLEQKDQKASMPRILVRSFYLAAALALLFGAFKIVEHFFFAGHGGDTPVVLIGGSVTVKQGSKDSKQNWSPHDNGFQTTSAYPIGSVALKQNSAYDPGDGHNDDDDDPTTDQQAVPVSSAAGWNVGLYTDEGNKGPNLIITYVPGSDIQLTLGEYGGNLCPPDKPGRRIKYIKGNCKADSKDQQEYTFAYAIVNSNIGATTLTCADSKGTKNHCRIVIRYPKTN
jgi:hypothetical protein